MNDQICSSLGKCADSWRIVVPAAGPCRSTLADDSPQERSWSDVDWNEDPKFEDLVRHFVKKENNEGVGKHWMLAERRAS